MSPILADTNPDFGWIMVAISQDGATQTITHSYTTISTIIAKSITSVIALYGIVLFALSGY